MNDMDPPRRRSSDPILDELLRRLDRHESNQEARHRENGQKLDGIREDVSTIRADVMVNKVQIKVLENWRETEVDPALEEGKDLVNRATGAMWLAGFGGAAGVVAAVKAFLFSTIGHP